MSVLSFIPIIGDILDKVLPDKDAQLQAKTELAKMAMDKDSELNKTIASLDLAQIDVNKVEAAQGGLLRGGWRPATGWVCVAALATDFIVRPLLPWFLRVVFQVEIPDIPKLDTDTLFAILFPLLGLGFFRTLERKAGKV